jgi:hypothetical protein
VVQDLVDRSVVAAPGGEVPAKSGAACVGPWQ